jgi:hypothetical protein
VKLPNSEQALISEDKVSSYLLNAEHKRGGSKAALLLAYGYSREHWYRLADDLRRDHLTADLALERATPYGVRYEIRAQLHTPSGRMLTIRSIWQIDTGTAAPRLITLFPD